MNNKLAFKPLYLLATISVAMMLSLPSFAQSRISDFDTPIKLIEHKDHLNVHEAEELINSDMDLVILDVRKAREFEKSHLEGAIHADYFSKDFNDRLAELDKDKPYIVYCKSGVRSDETVRRMNELGIENISVIGGGFRAWRAADKKIVDGGS